MANGSSELNQPWYRKTWVLVTSAIGGLALSLSQASQIKEAWDLAINLPYGPTQRSEIVPFVVATEIPFERLLAMECPDNVAELPFGRGVTMPVPFGTWFAVIGMLYTSTSLSKPEALAMQTAQAIAHANLKEKTQIYRGTVGGKDRNITSPSEEVRKPKRVRSEPSNAGWALGNRDAQPLQNQDWQ